MPVDCDQIRNEFSALLDNELNAEDRELVEEHLSDCSDCLRELHGYKVVSDIYRYHHPVKAPDDFEARFHAAIAPIGRKYTFAWQRWGLLAAAGLTVVTGVTLWQLRGSETPLDLSEMARNYASDSVPQSAPAAEAPVALRMTPAAPEPAPAAADSETLQLQDKLAAVGDGRKEDSTAAQRTRRADEGPDASAAEPTAAPATADAPKEMAVDQKVVLPSLSKTNLSGGGSAPQPSAAPASEATSSSPVLPQEVGQYAGSDISTHAEPGIARPVASPSPEGVGGSGVPGRAPQKMESTSISSAPNGILEPKVSLKQKAGDASAENSAAAAPASALVWRDLKFTLLEGAWRQEGYAGESATHITIPSERWNSLLDQYPDLAKLCDRVEPVIVKLGETWYQFAATEKSGTSTP